MGFAWKGALFHLGDHLLHLAVGISPQDVAQSHFVSLFILKQLCEFSLFHNYNLHFTAYLVEIVIYLTVSDAPHQDCCIWLSELTTEIWG